jgi:hypothetical protein
MRVILRVSGNPWWFRRMEAVAPAVELSKPEKLRQLVNAALGTPYFSQRQWTERLLRAESLKDLPVMSTRELLDGRARFMHPKRKAAMGMLRLPFETKAGVVMGRTMRVPRGVTVIQENMLGRLHLGGTRLIAATPPVLRRLCAAVEARALALPNLCEAVVVLGSVEDGFLFPGEREMLWQVLGVPVFEQWVGLDGELLAWECRAHQGLHFNGSRAELEEVNHELVVTSWFGLRTPVPRLATGLVGEADTRVCRCGDERPLLRGLAMARHASVQEEQRYAMAIA